MGQHAPEFLAHFIRVGQYAPDFASGWVNMLRIFLAITLKSGIILGRFKGFYPRWVNICRIVRVELTPHPFFTDFLIQFWWVNMLRNIQRQVYFR